MIQEQWKDIKGYEGLYMVSNIGQVKSLTRLKSDTVGRSRVFQSCILKEITAHHGYKRVNLYKGSIKIHFVHRLVADAFLIKNNTAQQVNHINGNKADNSMTNLEWCTGSENVLHAHRTGLRLGRRGDVSNFSKLKEIDVLEIRKTNKPQKEIAKKFNVSVSLISQILNRKVWNHLQ